MKVKHLVYTILALLVLIPLSNYFIFPYVQLVITEKRIAAGEIENKEEILKLLETTPLKTKKWEIIQDYMIEGGLNNGFDVYMSPTFVQWGGVVNDSIHFSKDEKIPFLADYVENGPINGYLVRTAKMLASFYEQNGDIEKAKEILFDAANRFSSQQNYHSNDLLVERIQIAKNHGQFREADQYMEELLTNIEDNDFDTHGRIAQIRTEMILQNGEVEKAYREVQDAIKKYEEQYREAFKDWPEEDDETSIENHVYYQHLKTLERNIRMRMEKNHHNSAVTISGQIVRSDGTPMKGIGVYLRDEQNVNRSVMPEDSYQIITDEHGRFEIHGVSPNRYQLALGFQAEQISGWTWPTDMNDWIEVDGSQDITYDVTLQKLIELKSPVNQQVLTDDKIRFEWEEVEGATSYSLYVGYDTDGGSVSFGFKTGIKGNFTEIDAKELLNMSNNIAIGPEDIKFPMSFLGFANPNNRLHWSVTAYDENGEIITQSNGYRLDDDTIGNLPFFYLKIRELTSTDKLLLQGETEKALEQYKADYKENPDDLHSLRMIIKLIGIEGDGTLETRDKLAIPYLVELAEKTNETGAIYDVAHYYYDQMEWDRYNDWINIYLANDGEMTDYIQSIHASALMMQGKHEDAQLHFEEALNKDKSHRFVGHWIANEIYRNGVSNEVKEIAMNYPERSTYETNPDWYLLVQNVMDESNQYVDYEDELRMALDLFFAGNHEELTNWLRTTDKKEMKKLIVAIQRVD